MKRPDPVGSRVSAVTNPPLLARLTDLIERHYQARHSPADYAVELNITSKALGRLVKSHFKRTLTELIRERLLKHAKWQLLHTTRPPEVFRRTANAR